MATTEKAAIINLSTQITNVINETIEPTINYETLSGVSVNSGAYDYTGSTINKFTGNANYSNTYVQNVSTLTEI